MHVLLCMVPIKILHEVYYCVLLLPGIICILPPASIAVYSAPRNHAAPWTTNGGVCGSTNDTILMVVIEGTYLYFWSVIVVTSSPHA